jgi:hypothetical protein
LKGYFANGVDPLLGNFVSGLISMVNASGRNLTFFNPLPFLLDRVIFATALIYRMQWIAHFWSKRKDGKALYPMLFV